jgi:hypothetical protein
VVGLAGVVGSGGGVVAGVTGAADVGVGVADVVRVADVVGGAVGVVVAGSAEGAADVAVARVGSAGDSVAIVTSYRMIDRNDHTWAGRVRDMV